MLSVLPYFIGCHHPVELVSHISPIHINIIMLTICFAHNQIHIYIYTHACMISSLFDHVTRRFQGILQVLYLNYSDLDMCNLSTYCHKRPPTVYCQVYPPQKKKGGFVDFLTSPHSNPLNPRFWSVLVGLITILKSCVVGSIS